MKRSAAIIFFSMLVLVGVVAFAEHVPDMGTPGDKATVSCSVEEVKFLAPSWGPYRGNFRGMFYVVELKVSSNSDIENVYLGPAMYLDRQDIKIGRYDTLEVKGFKKVFDGKTLLVAQEVTKSGHVLKLRDENGVPLWADGGMTTVSY